MVAMEYGHLIYILRLINNALESTTNVGVNWAFAKFDNCLDCYIRLILYNLLNVRILFQRAGCLFT